MDTLQHADAVTRRVDLLPTGPVVSLARRFPVDPRRLWQAHEALALPEGELQVELGEAPNRLRGTHERGGRTVALVALDVVRDGGHCLATLQVAPVEEEWREAALRWDRVLWQLGRRVDDDAPTTAEPTAAEVEQFTAAARELWEVAAVQAGA